MRLKKLLVIAGGLVLMLGLSGCSMIKGTRANIEKQFEVLSEIYPTQNVNDLRKKFPEGFTLYHKQYFGETVYQVVVEDRKSGPLVGHFRVGKNTEDSMAEETVFKIGITIDKFGKLVADEAIPSDYQDVFSNFTFLLGRLDLSREKWSKLKYKTHNLNLNNEYFISYYIKQPALYNYFDNVPENLKLIMSGGFGEDTIYYDKGVRIETDSQYISERIQSIKTNRTEQGE